MQNVTDEYKRVISKNVRPKCEPRIEVTGKDANGNDVTLTWSANNIKDLNFRWGIDPVGRTLPFLEATWSEIYTGKLNAQNYPEKYANITTNMTVVRNV